MLKHHFYFWRRVMRWLRLRVQMSNTYKPTLLWTSFKRFLCECSESGLLCLQQLVNTCKATDGTSCNIKVKAKKTPKNRHLQQNHKCQHQLVLPNIYSIFSALFYIGLFLTYKWTTCYNMLDKGKKEACIRKRELAEHLINNELPATELKTLPEGLHYLEVWGLTVGAEEQNAVYVVK